ncbi:MAG: galactose mutarotase [Candidatus Azobacteroides sp.]|nr:galactose mutarotase [Candidatus Azobacteroides sp.]
MSITSNTQILSGLTGKDFQKTVDGKQTDLYVLKNPSGMEVCITNYGAKIVSVMVPDKNGKFADVVLGHPSIDDYLTSQEPYFGAVCGRTGNRIAKGKFTLDGKEYTLAVNNGPNNLHGGIKGFHAVVWDAEQIDNQTIRLIYLSKDGEEGYPGNLTTILTYKLTDDNAVEIDYLATTDKPTIINLTNHSYFNLSGAGDPFIGDHLLTIHADTYLPTDDTAIPYGKPEKVEGTPMDFRTPHEIGARIDENFQQLIYGNGYDHTYVLNKEKDAGFSFCAKVVSPKTGIVMETYTTEPGVQLYTGNGMTGGFPAKGGKHYPKRSAFCLETQHFPDSINKPEYPGVVLRPGEKFTSQTTYKFSIINN